jgi:polyferredoxin
MRERSLLSFMARILFLVVIGLLLAWPASSPAQDEFEVWEEDTSTEELVIVSECDPVACEPGRLQRILVIGSLLATAGAGFLIRSRVGRKLRPLFLLTALVVLGFVWGGCPCPIMGFINLVLFCTGHTIFWMPVVWFLILVIMTYFLGRTWCGWICPLGGLQEFLYRKGLIPHPGIKTVKALRWIRRGLTVLLIAWLGITGINFWLEIDPFKSIFNLMVFGWSGWLLVGVTLILSLLYYRPFCRGACPLGLALGLVGKLPGAVGPVIEDSCISGGLCIKRCPTGAMDDCGTPNMENCIACGDCLEVCPKGDLSWKRRSIRRRR